MFNKNNNQITPLQFVRIGSTVDANKGNFRTSVVQKPITKLLSNQSVEKLMTGQSSYVYNNSLNQGSMGMSGSYGISAIEKVSAAVSAYVGNASASSTKKISLYYNARMISGIEYIDFGNLTPEDLINSLNQSAKQDILNVLDNFNKINKIINDGDLLNALTPENTALQNAINAWYNALQSFLSNKNHGDGLVVGVIWGGIGTVSLEISEKQAENNWKYGGAGSFTYSGLGYGVTVEAAYDGSQSNKHSDVQVKASSFSLGKCITKDIDTWYNTVAGKGFDELAKIDLMQSAPTITVTTALPSIPEFETPSKDSKVSDKIDKITNMDGLKAFATVSAYEKAKETNKELTLADFIKQSEEQADTSSLNQTIQNVTHNNVDTLTSIKSNKLAESEYRGAEILPIEQEKTASTDDFTPLGAWICNWADLFPWLSIGYLNQIENMAFAENILKKQCMIQDLLTLSKMYRTLNTCVYIKSTNFDIPNFGEIADNFDNVLAYLQETNSVIETAYKRLGPKAQAIYECWNDIKFLRNAELGLGYVYKNNKSIGDKFSISGTNPQYNTFKYQTVSCDFVINHANYSSFANYLKLLPLVTPNKKVYAFGPGNRLLKNSSNDDNTAAFTASPWSAMELVPDIDNKVLKSSDGNIVLYPIPFRAAENISWKGQGLSTNVGSMNNLQQQLKDVEKQLKNLKVYSFSSDNWKSEQKPNEPYKINSIKTQYLGIIKAPNFFSQIK